jgi:prepilin-type processing-associated H-X9-DG protein
MELKTGESTGGGICSASSNHSAGVNAVMFDGSVRFVNDSIDCVTDISPNPMMQRSSGKSYFGVWGAMGTPRGKE